MSRNDELLLRDIFNADLENHNANCLFFHLSHPFVYVRNLRGKSLCLFNVKVTVIGDRPHMMVVYLVCSFKVNLCCWLEVFFVKGVKG